MRMRDVSTKKIISIKFDRYKNILFSNFIYNYFEVLQYYSDYINEFKSEYNTMYLFYIKI